MSVPSSVTAHQPNLPVDRMIPRRTYSRAELYLIKKSVRKLAPATKEDPIESMETRRAAFNCLEQSYEDDLSQALYSMNLNSLIQKNSKKIFSYSEQRYEDALCQAFFNMTATDLRKRPILEFSAVKKSPPLTLSSKPPKLNRNPAQITPSRVLNRRAKAVWDAPELKPDFYSNPLSWSSKDMVAIALGGVVYAKKYPMSDGSATSLFTSSEESNNPKAVLWLEGGLRLAVGTKDGILHVVSETGQKVSTIQLHRSAMAPWTCLENAGPDLFLGGNRTGDLVRVDLREKKATKFIGITKSTIVGMALSMSQTQLAMGTNDQQVVLRDMRKLSKETHVLKFEHQSAVKALAWAPWNPHHLFTGAGTTDKCIRLFDVARNQLLDQVDTGSQISSFQISTEYQELVSTHGFNTNEIIVWKCHPKGKASRYVCPFDSLYEHKGRVLFSQLNHDQTILATAGEDETLRFWELFTTVKKMKKAATLQLSAQMIEHYLSIR